MRWKPFHTVVTAILAVATLSTIVLSQVPGTGGVGYDQRQFYATPHQGIPSLYLGLTNGFITTNAVMQDAAGRVALDIASRTVRDTSGNNSMLWNSRILVDDTGVQAMRWINLGRTLFDNNGNVSVDWAGHVLQSNPNGTSVDWSNYLLQNAGGTTLDWNNLALTGNWVDVGNFGVTGIASLGTVNATNVSQFGHPYLMTSSGPVTWYFNGQPSQQNIGQQNSDAELRFLNVNPFQSGGGPAWAIATTNAAGNGTAISTNTDSKPIYRYNNDPHIWSLLGVGAQDVANNIPGSLNLVENGEPNIPFVISAVGNQFPPGGNGDYPFMACVMDAGFVMHTYFSLLTSNIFNPTNPAFQSVLHINHNTGQTDFTGVTSVSNTFNIKNGGSFGVNGNGWAGGTGNGQMQLNFGDPTRRAVSGQYRASTYQPGGTGPISFDCDAGGHGLNINDNSGTDVGVPSFACEFDYGGTIAGWFNATSFAVTASGGLSTPSMNVTTTNGLVVGASTNAAVGTLVTYNFVAGTVYPNTNGRPIHVVCGVVVKTTGVAGQSAMQLRITGTQGLTNQLSMSTIATTLGETNVYQLEGYVMPGGSFQYIDVSSGAGDSTTTTNGQYMVH